MFRSALCFFTRLPVSSRNLPDTLDGIALWLPVVGLIIGGIVAAVLAGSLLVFPPFLCGILGCAVWVYLTGGLHLDGVADCGDGLFLEAAPERRLEVMRDSRLGTFGGIALFFTLACKTLALTVLSNQFSLWYMVSACLLAGLISRSMIFFAMRVPTARPGGLGEAIRSGTKRWHMLTAVVITLTACLWAGAPGWIALGAALFITAILLRTAWKRLGGVTGDIFGCLIEVTECGVLFSFCAGL